MNTGFIESIVEEGALCVYSDMKPDIMSGYAASGREHGPARNPDSNPDKVSGCVVGVQGRGESRKISRRNGVIPIYV